MSQSNKVIYRYRVIGDQRGWAYSVSHFFAEGVSPGPNEEHERLTLGEVSSILTSGKELSAQSIDWASEALQEAVADTYIVLNENALGLVHAGASREMEVLGSHTLKGGPNCLNGPVPFNPRIERIRQATLADFEAYRVSPVGHLS